MTLQERVDQLNKFIVDQNYRVEMRNEVDHHAELLAAQFYDKLKTTTSPEFVEGYLDVYDTYHSGERLTSKVVWYENCWSVGGYGMTNEQLEEFLNSKIVIYKVTEVKL